MAWKYGEDNKKEVFTRREIEKDIKSCYVNRSFWCTIILILLVFIDFMLFFILEKEKIGIVEISGLIICLSLQVAILVYIVLNVCRLFVRIDYKIVCDIFVCQKVNYFFANGIRGVLAFEFKTYGDFILSSALGGPHLHYDKGYYDWSAVCSTGMNGLVQSTYRNDEFYLIIINNKIRYVYNKKMFEFKETEKA